MAGKLKDKVAIVTGSGRGMGRDIAIAYAEQGADVVLTARTLADLEEVAGRIRALGRRALPVTCDVRREEEVNRVVAGALERFGKIDVLVASAGGSFNTLFKKMWEQPVKDWQLLLDINLTGSFISLRAVAPQMIKQGSGSIVFLSSWTCQRGEKATGFAGYAVAKWGIEGLTEITAEELKPHGVRVNAIRPAGVVATSSLLDAAPLTAARIAQMQKYRHGPLVTPDVIKPLAVFVASDESIGTTGQSLVAEEWNEKNGFGNASKYLWRPPKPVDS